MVALVQAVSKLLTARRFYFFPICSSLRIFNTLFECLSAAEFAIVVAAGECLPGKTCAHQCERGGHYFTFHFFVLPDLFAVNSSSRRCELFPLAVNPVDASTPRPAISDEKRGAAIGNSHVFRANYVELAKAGAPGDGILPADGVWLEVSRIRKGTISGAANLHRARLHAVVELTNVLAGWDRLGLAASRGGKGEDARDGQCGESGNQPRFGDEANLLHIGTSSPDVILLFHFPRICLL